MKNKTNLADWIVKVIKDKKAIEIIHESEDRIVKAYSELLSGYTTDPSKILNEVVRVKGYSGIVSERNIGFSSICGHHFLPFYGTVDIAYEPGEIITGLGKLPRVVQAYSRRFQIQESLNQQIAEQIEKSTGAKGVYVRSKATHLCMHSRGPSDRTVETICDYSLGTLKESDKQRTVQSMFES